MPNQNVESPVGKTMRPCFAKRIESEIATGQLGICSQLSN